MNDDMPQHNTPELNDHSGNQKPTGNRQKWLSTLPV